MTADFEYAYFGEHHDETGMKSEASSRCRNIYTLIVYYPGDWFKQENVHPRRRAPKVPFLQFHQRLLAKCAELAPSPVVSSVVPVSGFFASSYLAKRKS